MIVGVTGASGYIGQFIIKALLKKGYKIRALSRTQRLLEHYTAQSGQLSWKLANLDDESSLHDFVDGLDVIIHCAYQHQAGHYRYGEGDNLNQFLQTNLNGSLRLMQLAYTADVKRFIFLSSRAVYPEQGINGTQCESHMTKPNTFYGAYKAALDAFISAWTAQYNWHVCSLRITGVYGVIKPLSNSKWYDLAKAIMHGQNYDMTKAATEVHGDDVARAILLLLNENDSKGKVVNCSDMMVSNRQVAEIVQTYIGSSRSLPKYYSLKKPAAVMRCDYLQSKGFSFGGVTCLRQSIEDLVDAICLEQSRKQ
ncbi:NAD-dependent epimerase/dehydratase family protein [Shewanella surugensis]|uniref:SDR family oxidoreductase n=1 Tax=Shewanella surugensis TaxID=212020 RepID=A0ABT0L9K3_9GAMM|nr:SDR family oxidoreductase [Shewanella surugensis]MCL1123831.1 SDR family oxidoreductase [Shewanella surugensis]